MTRHTVALAAVAFAAGGTLGLLLGTTVVHPERPNAPERSRPEQDRHPVVDTGPAVAPRVAGDCQSVKNQLAICMAYHPPQSEVEKHLAMCRADLDACRDRPNLPACWDFIDLAPIYDRELGEIDPSPETIERARRLTPDACGRVLGWAERAGVQQRTCLKGKSPPPPGFAERYGRPVHERPLVAACHTTEGINAWLRREAERGGGRPLHVGAGAGKGGILRLLPDGRMVPWVPEEDIDASAP